MGTARSCNNAGSTGLTTRSERATKPTDCVATGGYVLPSTRGGNATLCTGANYAPNLNKLSSCLKCQSGLAPPLNYTGSRVDKTQVCQLPPGRFWELNVVRDCPRGLYRENYVLVTDKFEAVDRSNEEVGTCKQFIMAPVGPDNSTGKLYYKLPPSELIAATSVTIKTQSSSIYARCLLPTAETNLTADGLVGTSPFPDDIEKDKTFVRWNEGKCNSEATCEATCNGLATCWGYVYVPGKGYAIRGGEMQLGFRTFFAVPDATLATSLAMDTLLWGKPTS
eukprot:gene5178-5416_t